MRWVNLADALADDLPEPVLDRDRRLGGLSGPVPRRYQKPQRPKLKRKKKRR